VCVVIYTLHVYNLSAFLEGKFKNIQSKKQFDVDGMINLNLKFGDSFEYNVLWRTVYKYNSISAKNFAAISLKRICDHSSGPD
jgi:hypothetical protein